MLASRKILVVDDNKDLCGLLATILRAAGFTVETCQNSDAAIHLASNSTYDAVVMEPSPTACLAPLLDYLQHSQGTLDSVVIATTETDRELMDGLRSRGVFSILRKPLSRNAFTAAVRACCDAHPAPRLTIR